MHIKYFVVPCLDDDDDDAVDCCGKVMQFCVVV